MASLGAVLTPFPTLSNAEKNKTPNQVVEIESNNLKMDEVKYPAKTKIFRLPVLSE